MVGFGKDADGRACKQVCPQFGQFGSTWACRVTKGNFACNGDAEMACEIAVGIVVDDKGFVFDRGQQGDDIGLSRGDLNGASGRICGIGCSIVRVLF